MGEATLKLVSQPARSSDAEAPRPAGGEFSFRLLLHVDGTGTVRLLQHAYRVRKPPVLVGHRRLRPRRARSLNANAEESFRLLKGGCRDGLIHVVRTNSLSRDVYSLLASGSCSSPHSFTPKHTNQNTKV